MAIRMPKRTQHCTFCKNHGVNIPKKGHHCPHQNCNCILCKLTKKAQVAMRHQQRVWRHQKQKLKSQKFDAEELQTVSGEPKPSKSQACDKCRNHNILKMKRNHQCPFQNCKCDYCSLTFKRREIMKHQQRVRRSRITSQIESDGAPSAGEEPEEEEGDFTYYPEEGRRTSLGSANTSDASFRYAENNYERGQPIPSGEMKLNDTEVNDLSIASNSVSLRSTPDTETENSNPYHMFPSGDNFQPQGLEDLSVRESPPPLIHMTDKTHANSSFLKECESVSPPLRIGLPNPFLSTVARRGDGSGLSSPMTEKATFAALPFESFKEEPKDDLNSSVMLFHRERSSSLRSFPFSSQPLERLTALNASLDPSFKFTNPLEELRIRNYSFLPTSLIDPSLRNTSRPSSSSLLPPQYYQHQHQLRESNQATSQPIRPLPLNYSQMRHQGSFGPNLWNHMFFPFNFGLHQNATETSLMRFQGIVSSSRFSPFNSQYN